MGLLGDFTAYIDNLKRRGVNTAREFADDPIGLLGRNVNALAESMPYAPGEPQNEMLARPGMQDWAMGVAMNAPLGLLAVKPTNQQALAIALRDRLKTTDGRVFLDDAGNAFLKEKTPSGKELWAAGKINPKVGWESYDPNMRFFDSLEEAASSIRSAKAKAGYLKSQEKYSSIPRQWTGDSRRIAKTLIDNSVPIDSFASSTQSKSKYLTLTDGRKVRLSDHDLPLNYEGADIDFRYGSDISSLLKQIFESE